MEKISSFVNNYLKIFIFDHPLFFAYHNQCDQMARFCFIFCQLGTLKIGPIALKIAKVGVQNFAKHLKRFKNCLRL